MIASFERHRIPADTIRSGKVAKWTIPWVLSDVQRLATPVPYRHPFGAVTWVSLQPNVSEAIERQLGEIATSSGNNLTPCPAMMPKTSTPRAPVVSSAPKFGSGVIGEVELTQGNIDNNHIYLRSIFDQFPQDVIGGSNRHQKAERDVTVDWGGAGAVTTDLDGSKCFFRARKWIGDFFEQNDAKAGDSVSIEETGPYNYCVQLIKKALR